MAELTYTPSGDYLLPNLFLAEQMVPPPLDEMEEPQPLGKYGRMRKRFLQEHRTITYNTLLLEGKLHPHLLEIEQTATARMEQILAELALNSPPPDKASDQMKWTAHMNSLRQQAQEIVLNELVYSE